jgi:hypothetical protein
VIDVKTTLLGGEYQEEYISRGSMGDSYLHTVCIKRSNGGFLSRGKPSDKNYINSPSADPTNFSEVHTMSL